LQADDVVVGRTFLLVLASCWPIFKEEPFEYFVLEVLDELRLQRAGFSNQHIRDRLHDTATVLIISVVENRMQLWIDELGHKWQNLLFGIHVVNVGELLETVNLSADLLTIFDCCKHDALRYGTQYLLKLISLAPKLQFLRHRNLVGE